MRRKVLFVIWIACLSVFPIPVRADIAPPDQPPGANLAPDTEITQVRMVSEKVVIDLMGKIPEGSLGEAKVKASFTMHNLGNEIETIFARFPLTFWNGYSSSSDDVPEITDVEFVVAGEPVDWRRVDLPTLDNEQITVPWAEFGVTFPPKQDVLIEVDYSSSPVGEYPFVAYRYVLETGAGWKGSIGNAEIIVNLPYEANRQNVIIDETTGWSQTTPGAILEGNQVIWHFENFEPTRENNIEISVVIPNVWRMVLEERARVAENPEDGEAWGRLGKLYKEISYLRRWFREDEGGKELYFLSVEAYEKALELLPQDALWHVGFADLLWKHSYWDVFQPGSTNLDEMQRAVEEIKIAYDLKPENLQVLSLLDEMISSMPGSVTKIDDTYIFLMLTATPTIVPTYTITADSSPILTPTTRTVLSTATNTIIPTASPTQIPLSTNTPFPEPAEASSQTSFPLCGSALLLLPIVLMAIKKKEIGR
jgi:tetratricopeptide (TPR) repeat protein